MQINIKVTKESARVEYGFQATEIDRRDYSSDRKYQQAIVESVGDYLGLNSDNWHLL